ncbi:hypothetical protein Airi02_042950 [Actinoallomurus iriomotensis]|uniref:Uncharacterized protein n=1 Tax=Actinoallomurus iriomotensis TaxID=478107 RepID=A0A9W6S0S3_9ACTN|nr:hypothetical protein Airi02_042950 [Actinoallomurus iriomotensis]
MLSIPQLLAARETLADLGASRSGASAGRVLVASEALGGSVRGWPADVGVTCRFFAAHRRVVVGWALSPCTSH